MTGAALSKWLLYLGMALIAAFAAYTLYTDASAKQFSTKDLFGALAMAGLLLVLVGTVARQHRS